MSRIGSQSPANDVDARGKAAGCRLLVLRRVALVAVFSLMSIA